MPAFSMLRNNHLFNRFAPDLRDYDRQKFLRDLSVGVVVCIVALPLYLGLTIASVYRQSLDFTLQQC